MIDFKIANGGPGPGRTAIVDEDLSLRTSLIPYPPLTKQKTQPFRQYLTIDGLPTGSNDMGVDAATTNADFFIPAEQSCDRYITALSFLVGYTATGKPFQWADGAALTNGSRLFYSSSKGEVDIHEAIKSNQDLFRLYFGIIPTTWEVRHVNANNDFGYFLYMDLQKMGLPYGIKLDVGTKQRLTMRIRDDIATVTDSFDVIAYGFDRFE